MKIVSKSLFRLCGNSQWHRYTNTTLHHKNVLLEELYDIHPQRDHPVFEAESLFVLNCDKNWLYHNLNKSAFPKLKILCLHSHPDDQIKRLVNDFPRVFITDQYERSARVHDFIRNQDHPSFTVISRQTFFEALDKFDAANIESRIF